MTSFLFQGNMSVQPRDFMMEYEKNLAEVEKYKNHRWYVAKFRGSGEITTFAETRTKARVQAAKFLVLMKDSKHWAPGDYFSIVWHNLEYCRLVPIAPKCSCGRDH